MRCFWDHSYYPLQVKIKLLIDTKISEEHANKDVNVVENVYLRFESLMTAWIKELTARSESIFGKQQNR